MLGAIEMYGGEGGRLNIYSPFFSVQYNKYWQGIKKQTLYPEIISLFRDLNRSLNNPNIRPNPEIYELKARKLFHHLTTGDFKHIPLSPTVHRMVTHETSFIRHFKDIPIGALSESAIESKNKLNRTSRVGHARMFSFSKNTQDAFNHMLLCSDYYLFNKHLARSK